MPGYYQLMKKYRKLKEEHEETKRTLNNKIRKLKTQLKEEQEKDYNVIINNLIKENESLEKKLLKLKKETSKQGLDNTLVVSFKEFLDLDI